MEDENLDPELDPDDISSDDEDFDEIDDEEEVWESGLLTKFLVRVKLKKD